MPDEFAVVDLGEIDREQFSESGIGHRTLYEALGCAEPRVDPVTLAPGEATAPHTHERQEETYVALDGGHVRIDGTDHEVAPGGVVRVGPGPVRSVRHESGGAQTWVMVGAPPVGTVEGFGEYRTPDG